MAGKLVIGNWKMNTRADSAQTLLQAQLADETSNRDWVGVAAPAVYLAGLAERLRGQPLRLCAQDVSAFDQDGDGAADVVGEWREFYADEVRAYNESLWNDGGSTYASDMRRGELSDDLGESPDY